MKERRPRRPLGSMLAVAACTLVVARGANAQAAPPVLKVYGAVYTTQITLSWTAVTGATSYVLQYATNSQFTGAAQLQVPVNLAQISGLTAKTTYYFRCYGVAQPSTGWSSTLMVTTPSTDGSTTTVMNQLSGSIQGVTPTPVVFGTATCGGITATTMIAGQSLTSGQQIFSPNGQYRLRYQPDANFVLYLGTTTTALWATNKYSGNPGKVFMQPDGNLVTYDGNGVATWSTGTYGRTGVWLALQNDGNLVLYQGACTAIWHR